MSEPALRVLDLFFFGFHATFVLFAVLGWIPRRTRRWNLGALGLTAASWFGLGLFYGIGYCPLTDWHWRVLRALGERDLPRSYTRYLVMRVFGAAPPAPLMDAITGTVFALALVGSLVVNFGGRRRRDVEASTVE